MVSLFNIIPVETIVNYCRIFAKYSGTQTLCRLRPVYPHSSQPMGLCPQGYPSPQSQEHPLQSYDHRQSCSNCSPSVAYFSRRSTRQSNFFSACCQVNSVIMSLRPKHNRRIPAKLGSRQSSVPLLYILILNEFWCNGGGYRLVGIGFCFSH